MVLWHAEEVGQLQATIGELQHRNQELERKRTKDAQRHKKAAAAGAQAAAAALASELKVFMKRESPDKSHESSPAQVARANK